jgi:hypothetical protein
MFSRGIAMGTDMESALGDIGLGSLVVDAGGAITLAMVIAAMDGEHAFCVSTDAQKSVRQWRHRSTLRQAGRPAFD